MAEAQTKPGIVYPKDYSLINLTLLSAVTSLDMKLMMAELSYSEDLFNNTTSGYLLIADSMGYIEGMHLMGNEYIRMTFGKTDDPINWVDKLFRVYKVDQRKPEGNMNTESYAFYFCSDELHISEQYKVSKSYKGKSVSSNIQDILTTFLKVPAAKIKTIDNTYGTYDLIVPNLKPFDAINWMTMYARPSADKAGADMLFYEDKFGFNFRSLQTLIQQPVYATYNYEPKNITQPMQKKVVTVSTYEFMDSFDSLYAVNSGIFANRLISVDPLLRRYKTTDFNYATYAAQEASLNKHPITNNYTNRFNDAMTATPQAVTKLIFSNYNQNDSPVIQGSPGSSQRDVFAETTVPYRTAQMSLSNYTRIKISVPGDPGLTIGTVINFNLLSKNPKEKKPDAFYAGNYLITALRHMITLEEFKTVMEIAKDSNANPYAPINSGQAIWQNAVNGKMK